MARQRSSLQGKIDHICRVIFLTEEGKPKSTTLIYSFSLSLLFIVVLLVSYWLLLEPLEKAFEGNSVLLRNIMEYSVPALVGCLPCVALSFAFREKMNLVPAAFTWVTIIALIVIITMIFMVDSTDWATEYGLFMTILGIPMIVSAFIGTIASQIVYRNRKRALELRMEKYSSRR